MYAKKFLFLMVTVCLLSSIGCSVIVSNKLDEKKPATTPQGDSGNIKNDGGSAARDSQAQDVLLINGGKVVGENGRGPFAIGEMITVTVVDAEFEAGADVYIQLSGNGLATPKYCGTEIISATEIRCNIPPGIPDGQYKLQVMQGVQEEWVTSIEVRRLLAVMVNNQSVIQVFNAEPPAGGEAQPVRRIDLSNPLNQETPALISHSGRYLLISRLITQKTMLALVDLVRGQVSDLGQPGEPILSTFEPNIFVHASDQRSTMKLEKNLWLIAHEKAQTGSTTESYKLYRVDLSVLKPGQTLPTSLSGTFIKENILQVNSALDGNKARVFGIGQMRLWSADSNGNWIQNMESNAINRNYRWVSYARNTEVVTSEGDVPLVVMGLFGPKDNTNTYWNNSQIDFFVFGNNNALVFKKTQPGYLLTNRPGYSTEQVNPIILVPIPGTNLVGFGLENNPFSFLTYGRLTSDYSLSVRYDMGYNMVSGSKVLAISWPSKNGEPRLLNQSALQIGLYQANSTNGETYLPPIPAGGFAFVVHHPLVDRFYSLSGNGLIANNYSRNNHAPSTMNSSIAPGANAGMLSVQP